MMKRKIAIWIGVGIDIAAWSFAWAVMMHAQPQQQTILTTQQAVASSAPTISELGVRFTSDVPGRITAIRYVRKSADAGTHVGHLWSASGQLLGSALFTGETATGWQQQALTTPVTVSAGLEYSVSVNSGNAGVFAIQPNAFAAPIVNGHLKAIGGAYGTYGLWDQYQSPHLYFRDVVFEPSPAPPVVTITGPVDGTLAVGNSQAVASTVSGISAGAYTITVTARDALGQVSSASSTVTVPRLLQKDDLVYQGAFRLPQGIIGASAFSYGGSALAFNPARNSLFMVGHDQQQLVAEVSIPATGTGPLASLATASLLQTFADVTDGKAQSVANASTDQVRIGGLLPYNGKLIASTYVYYDGEGKQVLSHFVSGTDLSVKTDAQGPYQVGTMGAGFVSGYMANVPPPFQTALGGQAVLGNCCLSIISRTSYGPALFSVNQASLGTLPLTVTPLVYYTAEHPLWPWGGDSLLFNGSTNVTGVVFPANARSVLFFGKQGIGPWCYGTGTANQAQAGQPTGQGDVFCYDPTDSSKGGHGFPYAYQVWAYDAWDLAAVTRGEQQPWDIKPYATWALALPYAGGSLIRGAAYDPATARVFVTQQYGDGDRPLVHVFTVKGPA